jgi:hypothetical protein
MREEEDLSLSLLVGSREAASFVARCETRQHMKSNNMKGTKFIHPSLDSYFPIYAMAVTR